ncbi:hypothetical protein [Candidatus Bandiella numerosa]|uniref:hypothetical protein n=1 Tax=Candidatus Bandiella numerosa TaxID=2570586 RepID=UPI001F42B81C|nr:hypothetical protein [Candidatus Bandiella numerosa]
MNIFYLDDDIAKCAQSHADSHVIKMILESVQILCTALFINGVEAPYKPTHKKHPCTLWASESLSNWLWLKDLTIELNKEYKFRWNKKSDHLSYSVMASLNLPRGFIKDIGITQRPQAMPDIYKVKDDPLSAYRKYYTIGKRSLHRYTNRKPPFWLGRSDA